MKPTAAPRWTLVVSILGSTLAFVDGSVVNVALPVMQKALDATTVEMQWVIEAYALLLSAFVLVGGALGDRLGRRRIFLFGVSLFALASVGCGLAPNATVLVIARAVQGLGAALLVPGSLSLISAAYDEKTRGAAIGTWSAASAMTGALGPVLGGWVVTHLSWRWIFAINLPVAIIVVVLALTRVPESKDPHAEKQMDFLGASLATLGLGLIVYALVSSATLPGWLFGVLLGAGVLTLVAFVLAESKVKHPMVPLKLFRSPVFAGTNLLTLLLYAAMGGSFFFIPFLLVQVHGYSPAAAGAALLPMILLISVMSRATGNLASKIGPRWPLTIGPAIAAGGFVLFAVPGASPGTYWLSFFPAAVVMGLGMGVTVAPLTTAVMGAVDSEHAGVASGINNAVARAAGLLAVAVLGVVVVTRFNAVLDAGLPDLKLGHDVLAALDAERSKLAGAKLPDGLPEALQQKIQQLLREAYVAGFRAAMLLSAGLAALSAVSGFVSLAPSLTRRKP